MENVILITVILAILGGASFYIYRAKKRGEHCVGCPYAKECMSKGAGCGGKCGGADTKKNNVQ